MHTRPQQHLNRWPTAKSTSGHPRHAGGAHLVQRGREASGAGALCPPSGSRRGRASRRPLRCRPRRRQALQGGAAKRRRARCAIFPRRCRARRRPALQPRAGTCTWHRARQSRWSSARAARRSALRYTSAAANSILRNTSLVVKIKKMQESTRAHKKKATEDKENIIFLPVVVYFCST